MSFSRPSFAYERTTLITNTVLRSPDLAPDEKGLLAYLLSHAAGYELTMAQVFAENRAGRKAIDSAIRGLERAGYLTRTRKRDETGRLGAYHWDITMDDLGVPTGLTSTDTSAQKGALAPTSENSAFPQVRTSVRKATMAERTPKKLSTSLELDEELQKSKDFLSELADASPDPTPFDLEREDIRKIHDHFNASLVERGCKPKPATKASALAVRRMLDLDKRSVDQVLKCIDWVTADPFWSGNVLSLPKLRERYDQLRLQAQRPPEGLEPSRILEPAGSRSSGWRSQRSGTYRNYQNPRDSSIYLEGL